MMLPTAAVQQYPTPAVVVARSPLYNNKKNDQDNVVSDDDTKTNASQELAISSLLRRYPFRGSTLLVLLLTMKTTFLMSNDQHLDLSLTHSLGKTRTRNIKISIIQGNPQSGIIYME
jgi:hypothetical protein